MLRTQSVGSFSTVSEHKNHEKNMFQVKEISDCIEVM